jgi:hypothetical protein
MRSHPPTGAVLPVHRQLAWRDEDVFGDLNRTRGNELVQRRGATFSSPVLPNPRPGVWWRGGPNLAGSAAKPAHDSGGRRLRTVHQRASGSEQRRRVCAVDIYGAPISSPTFTSCSALPFCPMRTYPCPMRSRKNDLPTAVNPSAGEASRRAEVALPGRGRLIQVERPTGLAESGIWSFWRCPRRPGKPEVPVIRGQALLQRSRPAKPSKLRRDLALI